MDRETGQLARKIVEELVPNSTVYQEPTNLLPPLPPPDPMPPSDPQPVPVTEREERFIASIPSKKDENDDEQESRKYKGIKVSDASTFDAADRSPDELADGSGVSGILRERVGSENWKLSANLQPNR
ncbi:hypothetical protein MSG28_005976 [Choristoneura fumiferana]|uniref:Uncharacterized protein n=1 Tax=Choristoneura fumiferana TaxID=7141 RepID=A0ACC0L291_CHOFU|nr:hypothetical protein MSG28_005976 [Choristoneura fumiferana]